MEKFGSSREATGDNLKRRMRIACWITEAANTHSGFFFSPTMTIVKGERVLVLRYVYNTCHVYILYYVSGGRTELRTVLNIGLLHSGGLIVSVLSFC